MSTVPKPMLACAVGGTRQGQKHSIEGDLRLIRFPVIATPKVDGFRGFVYQGRLHSRSGKLIRNDFVQRVIGLKEYEGLDGELKTYTGAKADDFNTVQSKLTREEGYPTFQFLVFDKISPLVYADRVREYRTFSNNLHIITLETQTIRNVEELLDYEKKCLAIGYEGICFRHPFSPYKHGRSTFKEQYLMKMTRWTSSEASIIGVTEQLANTNEAFKGELGQTKRSTHKEGMVGLDTLGALQVRDIYDGRVFGIGGGTGMTTAMRQELWDKRDSIIGRVVTYRYKDYGVKELPRSPQLVGFRSEEDMGGE